MARRSLAPRPLAALGVLALGLAHPAPAAAQTRASGGVGLGPAAAAVRYDMAGGVSGIEVGASTDVALGRVRIDVAYGHVLLRHSRTEPDLFRLAVRLPVLDFRGVRLSAVGHAGASRYGTGDDRGHALAGGGGLALERPVAFEGGQLTPFAELRGLAAWSAGTILGEDAGASGQSLGTELGIELGAGRIALRTGASFDGLAGGLGPTAYPGRAFRLSAVYRF